MPIPKLDLNGALPPGEHVVTLKEVEDEFGRESEKRKVLMMGLKKAVKNFKAAKVSFILLDGSFTTSKSEPNDIDGCWSAAGDILLTKLDPLFWKAAKVEDIQRNRHLIKEKYGLDFFIAESIEGGSGEPFSNFFQTDRDGNKKGILRINL
jgi:hypothetical protein